MKEAASLVSPAFQAFGAIRAGQAAKAQAYSEAALTDRQRQDVDLQALQASEARRAELRQAMSTIEARRASANVGLDTPSAIALSNNLHKQSQRAESIDQVGFGNQKTALRTSALLTRNSGKSAQTQGYLKAGGIVANAAASAFLPVPGKK